MKHCTSDGKSGTMNAMERNLASRLLAQLVLMMALIVALPAASYAHSGHDHSAMTNSKVTSSQASVAVTLTVAEQRIAKSFQSSQSRYDDFTASSLKSLNAGRPVLTVSGVQHEPCSGCCTQGACCSSGGSCCPQSIISATMTLSFDAPREPMAFQHDAPAGSLLLNGLERPPKA